MERMDRMDDHYVNAHNAKVDFINQCSRDLEKKLEAENKKMHAQLLSDVNAKAPPSQNGHGHVHVQAQQPHYQQQHSPTVMHTNGHTNGHQQQPQQQNGSSSLNQRNGQPRTTPQHQHRPYSENYERSGSNKRVSPPHELVREEGPKTETIPPGRELINGSITTWKWSGEFERVQSRNKNH